MKAISSKKCLREEGDCIEGDKILIIARKIVMKDGKKYKLRASNQHHAYVANAEKNAKAVIKRKYTNAES